MSWLNHKIALTFIDGTAGMAFAMTEREPADLAESLDIETTLHIGDSEWVVSGYALT
jgi:hypothetical protein